MTDKNPHYGSTFDSFLEEEGMYDECHTTALKRVLAWQLEQEMERQNLNKTTMAKLMNTSRAQLDRLLDPSKTGITLETMQRAATAVGKQLRLDLV